MSKEIFIKIGLNFLLIISVVVYFVSKNEPTHGAFTGLLLGGVFLSITLSYVWLKIFNQNMTLISLTPIFILGYVVVFFSFATLRLINNEVLDQFEVFVFYDLSRIDTPLSLSTIGLISFLIGVTKRHTVKRLRKKDFSKKYRSKGSIIFIVILAYIIFGVFLMTTPTYMSGVYGVEISSLSNYLFTLFNWLLWSAIILKIFSYSKLEMKNLHFVQYVLSYGYLLLTLIAIYVLMSIYVGDRGPIISISIAIIGFFFARKKTISLTKYLIILILGATVLTVIGDARTRSSGDNFLTRVGGAAELTKTPYFANETFLDPVINLATSERALNHVVLQVPDLYDYHYGLNQFQYLLSVVPGLGGVFFNSVLEGDVRKQGSAMFTSYLIQDGDIKYGDGTSIISDLYLDFGWVGVISIMFIFGRVLSRHERIISTPGQIKILPLIFLIIYFSQSLYLARSALLLEVGTVIMIYMIIKINHLILFRENIQ